jgi:predicted ATPase
MRRSGFLNDQRLVREVRAKPDAAIDRASWPADVPAVAAVLESGLELPEGVTFLVGENGSGKSTLVESIAHAWQESLTAQVKHWGRKPFAEDASLWRELVFDAPWPRPQGGIWLRGEAMHERFARIDTDAFELRAFEGLPLNRRSHGEGFLAFLESRTLERGLWILDEPESALSFRSSLRLLALLHAMADAGSQVLLATHSPVLASIPGATVYELDGDGVHRTEVGRTGAGQGLAGLLRRPASAAAPPPRRLTPRPPPLRSATR